MSAHEFNHAEPGAPPPALPYVGDDGAFVSIDTAGATTGDVVTFDEDERGTGKPGFKLAPVVASLPDLDPSPAGIYGDATHVAQITVDAKGRVTDVAEVEVTGGGGGGGTTLYTRWDPLIPDGSPHALTHEFTSSDLSAFTQIYTGDAGVVVDADTTVPGACYFALPSNAYRIRSLLLALPVGDLTIHARGRLIGGGSAADNGAQLGIVLADGTTAGSGSQRMCALWAASTPLIYRWLSWNNFGNDASGAGASDVKIASGDAAHLRARRVSGAWYFAWSPDGRLYREMTASFAFSATHFGLGAQNYGGTTAVAAFDYLRVYATGTQYHTGATRNELG